MRLRLFALAVALSAACSPAALESSDTLESAASTESQAQTGQTSSPPQALTQSAPAEARPSQPAQQTQPARRPADAAPPAKESDVRVNDSAAVLKDFTERVDAYMSVRNDAKGDGPPLKETDNAAAIQAAQETLAANIRKARANAKPGDIFTPAIRARFRQLMYPELKGEDGQDAKAILKDDAPAPGAVPLKVNAPYAAETKPSVPVNVLMNLPKLPKELEYRIIGKDLVLLDVDANLIVDFVPNAIQ